MPSVLHLARPEILALDAYAGSMEDPASGRLHANESPWPACNTNECEGLNHYPEPVPRRLEAALASYYQVPADRILAVRGSDEGIDLLVRTFLRPGLDALLICPPTFGMYARAARIHGVPVVEVPLVPAETFELDERGVIAAAGQAVRMIFICTPNNPTGDAVDREVVRRIARSTANTALVVVDEAYLEFEGVGSMAGELDEFPNIIVLRTLSKALGMAGARCGAVIGRPEVIELLGRVRMPYAIPTAVTNAVRHALSPAALQALPERVNRIVHQRAILARQLAGLAGVDRVWPSVANFLLVRFHDANAARAAIAAAGIHVRDLAAGSHTAGCLRISIGTEAQNAALVTALAGLTT